MKKILLASILVSSVLLMAGNTEVKQIDTMQSLEVSMSQIQKGLLYNHKGMLKKGIASLRAELGNLKSFVIHNDKSIQFNAHEYAQKETKALDMIASRILNDFDAGKKDTVMIDYEQMLNRCVTCHALVRRW
jgi:cytochrome c556